MPGGFPLGPGICNGTNQGLVIGTTVGTALTCGTAGYGTYAQLVASTASDTCFVQVVLTTNGGSNGGNGALIKLAVGGAGSEVAIVNDLDFLMGGNPQFSLNYAFPLNIPAGTRIAAAGYCSNADTYYVNLTTWDGSFTNLEGVAGIDSMGTSSAHGTSVAFGAAAKGAYAQLTASTARDYMGVFIGMDGLGSSGFGNGMCYTDLAIGAGGSEIIIVPNICCPATSAGYLSVGGPQLFLPINIPAGTRVSARGENTGAASNVGIIAYGAYQ